MVQRSAGAAYAGLEDWRPPQGGRAFAADTLDGEHAPCCPLVIIARGIVVLSILVASLGLALANFGPQARLDPFAPSAPQFALAERPLPPPRSIAPHGPTLVSLKSPVALAAVQQNPDVRRSFLTLLQSALASRQPVLQFGPVRVKRSIVQTIIRAAQETDTDPVLLMAIADKESSFATGVEAHTSSAMGLFQFVDATWLKAVRQFGAKYGLSKEAAMISGSDDHPYVVDPVEREHILELRKDPYLSAVLAAEMLKFNSEKIAERIGRGLTGGETYLAHFLGPDDAEKFMEKVVGQPQYTAAALLPRPAHANASIFYARAGRRSRGLSVAAVHDKFEEMMGVRLDRYKSIAAAAGLSAFADTAGQ
jgi:Transglycosylase SLT domain